MSKTVSIRLSKTDDGEFCFKYRDSDTIHSFNGLSSIIEKGIKQKEISNGIKVVDNDYVRYIFNYYTSSEVNAVQEPIKIVIRIRKEYINEAYNILKGFDALCLQTKYIKSKNLIKILAVSLAGLAFISIAGAKMIDRIKDPEHYDFGRNGEYSSGKEENLYNNEILQNEKNRTYDEVYNSIHR